MRFTCLLLLILITFVFCSCQTGPKKGEVTKIDTSNAEKYLTQNDVTTSSEGFLLKNHWIII